MDYSKDYNNDREPLDLHEVAGLLFQGIDEDGSKEWLGTKAQWNKFAELERQESIDLEIDIAIEKKHELIDEGLRALKDNNALND